MREHRIGVHPQLLSALDLGVPIGALYEAHVERSTATPHTLTRQGKDSLNRSQDLRVVCLHRNAEPPPFQQVGMPCKFLEELQLERQALRFLGVDRQAGTCGCRGTAQAQRTIEHLSADQREARRVVTLVDRGQLDGYAVASRALRISPDGIDGVCIARQAACRVVRRARTLAQHVEGKALRVAPRP